MRSIGDLSLRTRYALLYLGAPYGFEPPPASALKGAATLPTPAEAGYRQRPEGRGDVADAR